MDIAQWYQERAERRLVWYTIGIIVILYVGVLFTLFHSQRPSYSKEEQRINEDYALYNMYYFNNNLPHDTQVICGKTLQDDALGETERTSKKRFIIIIDNQECKSSIRIADFVLLHEMVHVDTWDTDGDVQHGAHFVNRIMELKDQGAYNNLLY